MVIAAVALGILALIHYAVFRAARRAGRTIGLVAWRTAQGAIGAFVLAVVLYEKPKSFYTNFVIFPSLALYISGLLFTIAALIVGVTALFKRDDSRNALIAIGSSIGAAAAAIGLIIWRAS
jgi:hypothetical protein